MRRTPARALAITFCVIATDAGSAPKTARTVTPLALGDAERALWDREAREPATEVRIAPSPFRYGRTLPI